ncbi:MAG: glycerate kinase [Pseudomonadota bacterium]|uniref:glycerate kinase n=1 Tax=Burkholderia sp. 4M9327F10 TaxID=2502223 RepID=UPI0010F9C229|nr:glycerate kinase [Burkholderia sp. 4M9327F10]
MHSTSCTQYETNDSFKPRIVLTPDSYKGSLSAKEVAHAMSAGIRRVFPCADIIELPIADGGEGTIDALLSAGGREHHVTVRSARGNDRSARVAVLPDGTGVVEIAEIVGITDREGISVLLADRTTLGVGDAILALLDRGIHRIYVGLGGSSTSDAGAGMLVALGARLTDFNGNVVEPLPSQLNRVEHVDVSGLDPRLDLTEIILLCDVDNPLTGPNGAAAIFGAQKGGTPEQLAYIDDAVSRFATLLESSIGVIAAQKNGAGAAGGLGFAFLLLQASAKNGAAVVLDAQDFSQALRGAHWHLTGEGRSDLQSIRGKAPSIAAKLAADAGVPSTLISGSIDPDAVRDLAHRFAGCFSIAPGPVSLEVAIQSAASFIANTTEQAARLRFTGCSPHSPV